MPVLGHRPGRRFAALVARHDDRNFARERYQLLEHARLAFHRAPRRLDLFARAHPRLTFAVVAEARAFHDAGQKMGVHRCRVRFVAQDRERRDGKTVA